MGNIPEEVLRKRMTEWRNFKVLHPKAKEKNKLLKKEVRTLKGRVEELETENKLIEKLQLQLEELRALKFGKKREKRGVCGNLLPPSGEKVRKASKKEKRTPESYRRSEPAHESITDHLLLELPECPECGEPLKDKKQHTHYREDLQEVENLIESAKKVVETIIESGKCESCDKRQFAMEIPKQKVIIGENIRCMVVYMTVVQGQSYSEVQRGLSHQYGISLSSGEVANILEGESTLLTPAYNHITETLEQESETTGCHYDESSWKTESRGGGVSKGNYCWVKIGVQSENRLIWFGRSRGKEVAEALRGEKEGSRGVSDDYVGYRNLFDHHSLCWAHPHRKLRDLAGSGILNGKGNEKIKKTCQKAFKEFAKVYQKAERARKKLQSGIWTKEKKEREQEKLMQLFENLFDSTPHDPEKLHAIRESLKERKERYFTFFEFPCLPLDNNKAERAIRKIVLRRKKSFGCRSQKGADVLSILYSVLFSLMESNPNQNFFSLYREAKEGVSE